MPRENPPRRHETKPDRKQQRARDSRRSNGTRGRGRLVPAVLPANGLSYGGYLGRRFRRWSHLTEHVLFPEIVYRLRSGYTCTQVAHWLRQQVDADDVFGSDHRSFHAVEVMLDRFGRLLPELAEEFRAETLDKLRAEVHDAGADHLMRLTVAARMQEIRVERGLALEKETGFPSEQVRREMSTLADYYRQLRDTRAMLGLDANVMPPPTSITGSTFSQTNLIKEVHLGEGLERTLVERPELLPMVMPHLVALEAITVKDQPEAVDDA